MSHNDITGDKIKSKVNSDKFRDNWDKVFGKKPTYIILDKVDMEPLGEEFTLSEKEWLNLSEED